MARTARVLRWTARILGGVVALVAVGAGGVYALSERRLHARFVVPDHPLAVHDDSATVARGKRLATVRGCGDCHGATFGGGVMIDDPAIGRLSAANLTRGGRGAELSPEDWDRAVRHGVRRDGSTLLLMPSHEYQGMSDEDLGAIAAYVRSLPADTAHPPASKAGPVGRALYLAGKMPLVPAEHVDHERPHVARVAEAPTKEYGAYLAAGCTGCHGANFSGGPIAGAPPGWKPAANITPAGIGRYSEADFARALREGRRPDGSAVDSLMPVKALKHMTDVEVQALYAYLRTVPARPYASR